jgi:uncharacterized protein with HEPN domain
LPSEKPIRRLEDIVDNAKAILRYTDGMDLVTFREDRKTADAVERCLERISEAASKLGDEAFTLVPGQPWGQIKADSRRSALGYRAKRPSKPLLGMRTSIKPFAKWEPGMNRAGNAADLYRFTKSKFIFPSPSTISSFRLRISRFPPVKLSAEKQSSLASEVSLNLVFRAAAG